MNLLPSFYTTTITCMHSPYTPPLCHALPNVSELTVTELVCFKLWVNKIKHSVNMECLLQYDNVLKQNKQSNNTILSLPVPSH
jgi:hypothetical protein